MRHRRLRIILTLMTVIAARPLLAENARGARAIPECDDYCAPYALDCCVSGNGASACCIYSSGHCCISSYFGCSAGLC